jgi:hypothetical protein
MNFDINVFYVTKLHFVNFLGTPSNNQANRVPQEHTPKQSPPSAAIPIHLHSKNHPNFFTIFLSLAQKSDKNSLSVPFPGDVITTHFIIC